MEKPILRGHFHQAAFFFALGACLVFLSKIQHPLGLAAGVIYSISLCGLFGISALYHRPMWSTTARKWMRRLDHSAIFVLIAGTSTPIFLLGLPPELGKKLLFIIWSVASFGILQSLFWAHAPKWVSATLYLGAGWWVSFYYHDLQNALNPQQLLLMLLGGLAYSIGAVIYACKRPNPIPKYFGHHEIFHLLVIVGALLHFLAVYPLFN